MRFDHERRQQCFFLCDHVHITLLLCMMDLYHAFVDGTGICGSVPQPMQQFP